MASVSRSSITNESLHLPSRLECSPEVYVRKVHAFLSHANYDSATHKNVVRALRLTGNITNQDIELAKKIGLTSKKNQIV